MYTCMCMRYVHQVLFRQFTNLSLHVYNVWLNVHTHTQTHTNTPLDHWTPIAGGDDSDATAEAIAACAGIAPFNSLQG